MDEMKVKAMEGSASSSKLGTKVRLAGRTMYLPNSQSPIIYQKLTLRQINAIPRDKYGVRVLGRIKINKERRILKALRLIRKNELFRHRSKIPFDIPNIGIKTYETMLWMLGQLKEGTDMLYYSNRELSRNNGNGDGTPPDEDLFYPPIDEGKLSDCIIEIIFRIFGNNDKGLICGTEYKLSAFCVLMHYYFLHIGILQTKAQKPFCDYLEQKVFLGQDKPKFTARTFNNCANKPNYNKIKEDYAGLEPKEISFNTRPSSPSKSLLDAFQEVGWNFQKSNYFEQLKYLRDQMNTFRI